MTETAVRHHPKITRTFTATGLRTYRHECPCGDCGEPRTSRSEAIADQAAHVAGLPPVPADQQCHDPRRHRVRPWEPCPLCADQTSLFAL